jgi:hypothetical protein
MVINKRLTFARDQFCVMDRYGSRISLNEPLVLITTEISANKTFMFPKSAVNSRLCVWISFFKEVVQLCPFKLSSPPKSQLCSRKAEVCSVRGSTSSDSASVSVELILHVSMRFSGIVSGRAKSTGYTKVRTTIPMVKHNQGLRDMMAAPIGGPKKPVMRYIEKTRKSVLVLGDTLGRIRKVNSDLPYLVALGLTSTTTLVIMA